GIGGALAARGTPCDRRRRYLATWGTGELWGRVEIKLIGSGPAPRNLLQAGAFGLVERAQRGYREGKQRAGLMSRHLGDRRVRPPSPRKCGAERGGVQPRTDPERGGPVAPRAPGPLPALAKGSADHAGLTDCLRALQAMRLGDFSARMAGDAPGLLGKI